MIQWFYLQACGSNQKVTNHTRCNCPDGIILDLVSLPVCGHISIWNGVCEPDIHYDPMYGAPAEVSQHDATTTKRLANLRMLNTWQNIHLSRGNCSTLHSIQSVVAFISNIAGYYFPKCMLDFRTTLPLPSWRVFRSNSQCVLVQASCNALSPLTTFQPPPMMWRHGWSMVLEKASMPKAIANDVKQISIVQLGLRVLGCTVATTLLCKYICECC